MQTTVDYRQQTLTISAERFMKSWRETPYDELPEAPTLNRAQVNNVYAGDIEGESWEEYLMLQQTDGQCNFVSMERVIGSLDGRSGSFVIQGIGAYEGGISRGQLTIVANSGTGELAGLRGRGTFIARKGEHATVTLHCEFV